MGTPGHLKPFLADQVARADNLCRQRKWKAAWRILLRASRTALDMATKSDGSERDRYMDYSDRLRKQAETIRVRGKLKPDEIPDRTSPSDEGPVSRRRGRSGGRDRVVRKLKKLKRESGGASGLSSRETIPESTNAGDEWLIRPQDIEAVSFDDVAGLAEVKKEIISLVILPFCDPEGAGKYNVRAGGGMLLYGPPGTGKTMIAKAVANEVDAPFFSITPAQIMDKHVGEAEQRIARLFRQLHSLDRAVLFIDEAEGLLTSRSTHSTVMKRVVPQFLMELDGLTGRRDGLMVIAATNVPWELDEAAYRRLPSMIYVPLPDRTARFRLLKNLAGDVERLGEVDFELLADRTDGFSGSDLKQFFSKTCRECYCESVNGEPSKRVETADFLKHLDSFSRTVSRKNIDRFERFRREFRS